MIVFNLSCKLCNYSFEGWFENTKDFNKQINQGMVCCPSCNSIQIKKGLIAPNVAKKSNAKISKRNKSIASNVKKIKNPITIAEPIGIPTSINNFTTVVIHSYL